MPTGYTSRLEKINYDVKRWLKEDLVRGMGICIMLRDSGAKSEAEIKSFLKEEANKDDYHTVELEKARSQLDHLLARSESAWEAAFQKETAEAEARYQVTITFFNRNQEKHLQATNEVTDLLAKAIKSDESESVIGTLRFAKEQLETAFLFDYRDGVYREEVLNQNLSAYRTAALKSAAWKVEHHTREAGTQIDSERYRGYLSLCSFLDESAHG